MGFERTFVLGLAWRLLLVLALGVTFAASLAAEGLAAARVVAAALTAAAVYALWRFVQRTNIEVARFVEAIRFGDLAQNFTRHDAGSGFQTLGEALDRAIRALREERARAADRSRVQDALLDDAPVALLTVGGDGRVELVNKAARRLFQRHRGTRVADFEVYGEALAGILASARPGSRRIVPVMVGSSPARAVVTAGQVKSHEGDMRVVAVEPIQGELSSAEISTQTDLVRVLTHEIMNSMTPVTSLARTAASLVAEADRGGDPLVADARAAIETLARRADGVMHFVESYRQISRKPDIRLQRFAAAAWVTELQRLFTADWPAAKVEFTASVEPADLMLELDLDLMTQVLINILRNAAEAAIAESSSARVTLGVRALPNGVEILVADNGPGIPESVRNDVFLPFFTTKAAGTGVGLSLARQVVVAHGGSIAVERSDDGLTLARVVI